MAAVLEGRVAIVTGAGRGIGRAVTQALVSSGAEVVIADHGAGVDGSGADPTMARDLAGTLGRSAIAFTDSVASPGAAAAAVDLAVRRFGSVDIVVNAACIRRDTSLVRADAHDWEAVIRTNLSAPFHLTAAASAVMQGHGRAGRRYAEAGGGCIVNMVDPIGLQGGAGRAPQASAMAGLLALTRAAALDLAPAGIAVNAMLPLPPTGTAALAEPISDTPQIDAGAVAQLVVALCLPAARPISGLFLAVRERELLLLDQAGPAAHRVGRIADGDFDALIAALLSAGAGTPLDASPLSSGFLSR